MAPSVMIVARASGSHPFDPPTTPRTRALVNLGEGKRAPASLPEGRPIVMRPRWRARTWRGRGTGAPPNGRTYRPHRRVRREIAGCAGGDQRRREARRGSGVKLGASTPAEKLIEDARERGKLACESLVPSSRAERVWAEISGARLSPARRGLSGRRMPPRRGREVPVCSPKRPGRPPCRKGPAARTGGPTP